MTAPGVPDATTATDVSWTGNQTIGSAASPVVIHLQSNLFVAGNITGYGVLVVDGTLTITGAVKWNGVLIVGGCPTCNGDLAGTGTSDIYGALVVGNSTGSQSHLNGNANIHYSCEGIAIANSVFPNPFFIVSWNEVD